MFFWFKNIPRLIHSGRKCKLPPHLRGVDSGLGLPLNYQYDHYNYNYEDTLNDPTMAPPAMNTTVPTDAPAAPKLSKETVGAPDKENNMTTKIGWL